MKRRTILWILIAFSSALSFFIGCRASPDDAAGQAQELSDPVRRQNAVENISRLYSNALEKASGDRTVASLPSGGGQGPKAIADATVEPLARTYTEHPEDAQNGGRIMTLLADMRDPRAIRAYRAALAWRNENTEQHAITAARALEVMEIPDGEKEAVVTSLSDALDRIEGSRGVDNQMRIQFLRTLRALHDRRAAPILTKIATRLTEDQSFVINRMAGEALGDLGDPSTIPTLTKALFLFAPTDPRMRMNDVGAQGLATVGRPSVEPMLVMLRGENAEALRIATNYQNAVRRANQEAGDRIDPRTLTIEEACFTLGLLGFREAIDPMAELVAPLIALGASEDDEGTEQNRQTISRGLTCSTSLVRINREDSDTPRLRELLTQAYNAIPESWPPEAPYTSRAQILGAMKHTYDPGLLDFLYEISANREGLPDFRVVALQSYAFLAAREDVGRLRNVISAEPEGGEIRRAFEEMNPALDTAQECGEELACYIRKLGDSNPMIARKAAYMIARYGRGNAEAITALLPHFDHMNIPVRGDVFYAFDWVATNGSAEAVREIDRINDAEEGRSSWNQIRTVAMETRARLQARGSRGGGG